MASPSKHSKRRMEQRMGTLALPPDFLLVLALLLNDPSNRDDR